MKPFDLRVLTMNKPFFEGKCSSLVVPIKSGQYGILADHCKCIAEKSSKNLYSTSCHDCAALPGGFMF